MRRGVWPLTRSPGLLSRSGAQWEGRLVVHPLVGGTRSTLSRGVGAAAAGPPSLESPRRRDARRDTFRPWACVWSLWGWLCPEQRQGGWGQPSHVVVPRKLGCLVRPGASPPRLGATLHRPTDGDCSPGYSSRPRPVDAPDAQNLRIGGTASTAATARRASRLGAS